MGKRDYYDVLGIGRGASSNEIKAAYRKLARTFHPDVNKAADAADKFREATEAYEVLSDDQKRKMYDQFGHAASAGGGPAGPAGGGHPGGVEVHFEDIFGGQRGRSGFMGMGLQDIMDALRSGGAPAGRRPRTAQRPKGADMEYDLTLDFLQAVRGATTTVRMQRRGARGKLKTETIDVKIPAGVRDGQQIRVRGKGQGGPGGSGDLYIIVHVGEHPYFQCEGDDIYVDVPISMTEAALGTKVDVPTIDGMTTVRIPPGTGGGTRLRLKGKGIARAGRTTRGHQYVRVRVQPPQKLSDRQKRLLEELHELDGEDARKSVPWA